MYDASPVVAEQIDREYFDTNHQPPQSKGKIGLQQCMSIVSKIGAKIQGVHLFLDALNESQDAQKALGLVKELIRHIPSCWIMLSATEELDATYCPEEVHVVPIRPNSIDLDIRLYIETSLNNSPSLARLPSFLKARIRTVLQKNHDGMYVISKLLSSPLTILKVQMGTMSTRGVSSEEDFEGYPQGINRRSEDTHRYISKYLAQDPFRRSANGPANVTLAVNRFGTDDSGGAE